MTRRPTAGRLGHARQRRQLMNLRAGLGPGRVGRVTWCGACSGTSPRPRIGRRPCGLWRGAQLILLHEVLAETVLRDQIHHILPLVPRVLLAGLASACIRMRPISDVVRHIDAPRIPPHLFAVTLGGKIITAERLDRWLCARISEGHGGDWHWGWYWLSCRPRALNLALLHRVSRANQERKPGTSCVPSDLTETGTTSSRGEVAVRLGLRD